MVQWALALGLRSRIRLAVAVDSAFAVLGGILLDVL